MPMTWLLYGAYGYTGRLVVEAARRAGEEPVLAGRDASRLEPMARSAGFEHRVFGLGEPSALRAALTGIDAVVHCAGPFSATARPMLDACLATGTHYLDITGEIAVFEAVLQRHQEAVDAGVSVLPGSGFDVVPSDCLAAMLAKALPGATSLELAFRMDGGVSPGTARTAIESLGSASLCRVGSTIVDVPADRRRRQVTFADGEASVTAVSWGDVATAYYSTGIPDITVYTALPGAMGLAAAAVAIAGGASRRPGVQRALKGVVDRLPGPSGRARRRSVGQLWGRATDGQGSTVTGTMTTPNAYTLTADAVLHVVSRLASGGIPHGALTPAQAFGPDLAAQLPGVTVHAIG